MIAFVLLCVVGLPLAVIGIVALRIRAKRRAVDALVDRLLAPYERLPHDCFRANGRVFRLVADTNPLFSRDASLRLSTFAPTTLELEIRAARNVPTKTPQKLADDPYYRRYVLDAPSADEAVAHLLAVKETVARILPSRWGAYSKIHCETVLSANKATHGDLAPDLPVLAALAAAPAAREPRGGTWTLRRGFEPHVPAWHWKPEQRARLPQRASRWCVSAWYDNAYLNRALARFLWSLGDVRVVTTENDLWFLEHAFGRPFPVRDLQVELAPDAAVAGDQWLDGELVGGLVAGAAPDAFARAIKFTLHDRSLDALNAGARFIARRLFDDEFSWFSGEYEIVSAVLTDDDVASAFEKAADEFGAAVKEIDRPFSFKLLKEDRLDLAF